MCCRLMVRGVVDGAEIFTRSKVLMGTLNFSRCGRPIDYLVQMYTFDQLASFDLLDT